MSFRMIVTYFDTNGQYDISSQLRNESTHSTYTEASLCAQRWYDDEAVAVDELKIEEIK